MILPLYVTCNKKLVLFQNIEVWWIKGWSVWSGHRCRPSWWGKKTNIKVI